MKKVKSKILFLFVMLLAFSACKKGDTGPAGASGTNGTNGNANVKNKSFNLTAADWGTLQGTASLAGNYYKTVITDADITADIISKGAVIVYFNNNQLPMTENYPAYTRSYSVVLSTAGQVEIRVGDSDGNSQNPNSVTVRVVVMASSGMVKLPDTYTEVQKLYNLND